MNTKVREALEQAIATMESFVDDAKRIVAHREANPSSGTMGSDEVYAIRAVQHNFAWGIANATTSIEMALATFDRELGRKAREAKQAGG